MILGANLLITEVEQDLLDPAFGVVIDHIPEHVASCDELALGAVVRALRDVPSHLAYNVAQSRHPGAARALDTMWSRLMTDQVFVMALPTETLRLGRDIPPRHRHWPYLPPHLRTEPKRPSGDANAVTPVDAALGEIVLRLHAVDRTTGNGHGSAARDIRRWDERLNWSATLLRTCQQDGTLWWAPYRRPRRRADPGPEAAGALRRSDRTGGAGTGDRDVAHPVHLGAGTSGEELE